MDGYGKRVLVVDDDETTRMLTGIVLEGAGYNVVLARDGFEACHEVNRRHFDVIITDLFMPMLNGTELLGRIHAVHPRIPVILLSGALDHNPDVIKAYAFFACPQKPFAKQGLLTLVRSALELHTTDESAA